jgi:hypothetical protein
MRVGSDNVSYGDGHGKKGGALTWHSRCSCRPPPGQGEGLGRILRPLLYPPPCQEMGEELEKSLVGGGGWDHLGEFGHHLRCEQLE